MKCSCKTELKMPQYTTNGFMYICKCGLKYKYEKEIKEDKK